MKVSESFSQLPAWAKGVVGVIIVGGAAFLTYKLYKGIQGAKSKIDVRRDENKLKSEGQKQSYPNTAYKNFADKIYQAGFVFGGTDEDAIYDVFKQMKNDLDVVLLVKAFGQRRVEFSLQDAELGGFLTSELNSSEITKINEILNNNGITYRF